MRVPVSVGLTQSVRSIISAGHRIHPHAPADAATTGHDLERGGEVAAIDGFESFSFLDEPKANAFRSRYRRNFSEIHDLENTRFDLTPHRWPTGAGQAAPFADPPTKTIVQLC